MQENLTRVDNSTTYYSINLQHVLHNMTLIWNGKLNSLLKEYSSNKISLQRLWCDILSRNTISWAFSGVLIQYFSDCNYCNIPECYNTRLCKSSLGKINLKMKIKWSIFPFAENCTYSGVSTATCLPVLRNQTPLMSAGEGWRVPWGPLTFFVLRSFHFMWNWHLWPVLQDSSTNAVDMNTYMQYGTILMYHALYSSKLHPHTNNYYISVTKYFHLSPTK